MVVRRLQDSELYHHGIKGQKWGVRRYQNYDGTSTEAGKARYSKGLKNRISSISPETKKRLKIAATAVAGLTLVGAAAYIGYKYGGIKVPKNKITRNDILQKTPKAKRVAFNKKIDAMDDNSLEKAITRLSQEKKYRDLYNEKMGKVHVNYEDAINKVANATVYASVAGLTGFGLRAAITGQHDREMLADYVAPKPNGQKKKK